MDSLHVIAVPGEGITMILYHFNESIVLLSSQSMIDVQGFFGYVLYGFLDAPLIFFI
jgi:hypothetical protein